jgi:hypothetical protein
VEYEEGGASISSDRVMDSLRVVGAGIDSLRLEGVYMVHSSSTILERRDVAAFSGMIVGEPFRSANNLKIELLLQTYLSPPPI